MPEFTAYTQDLTAALPRGKQPLVNGKSPLLGLVVHHEPDEEDEVTVWSMATAHVRSGLPSIRYHFVVDRAGVIYITIEPHLQGNHARYVRGDDIRKFPNR